MFKDHSQKRKSRDGTVTKGCHQEHRLLPSFSFIIIRMWLLVIGLHKNYCTSSVYTVIPTERKQLFVYDKRKQKRKPPQVLLPYSYWWASPSASLATKLKVVKQDDCPVSKLFYEMSTCNWHIFLSTNSRKHIHSKLSFVVRGKQNLNSEVLISLLDPLSSSTISHLLMPGFSSQILMKGHSISFQ